MAYDVFISYSSQDKLTADAVCAVLEAKGVRCWIAPRDISLGSDWTESIVNAVESCRVMVLIFSAHANESHQIKREVNLAVDNGVTIIPLRVEDVMPSKSLKYSIKLTHWLDAFPPPLENHLDFLADSIRAHLRVVNPGAQNPELETGAVAPEPAFTPGNPNSSFRPPPVTPASTPPPAQPAYTPLAAYQPPPAYHQPQPGYQPQPAYPPNSQPPRREKNVGVMIVAGVIWSIVMTVFLAVIFWIGGLFIAGAIAGATHPDNPGEAGRAAGEAMSAPLLVIALFLAFGLSVWLWFAFIGKLSIFWK